MFSPKWFLVVVAQFASRYPSSNSTKASTYISNAAAMNGYSNLVFADGDHLFALMYLAMRLKLAKYMFVLFSRANHCNSFSNPLLPWPFNFLFSPFVALL